MFGRVFLFLERSFIVLLRSTIMSCLVLLLVGGSGVATWNEAPIMRLQPATINEHLLWQYQLATTPVFTSMDALGEKVAVVIGTHPPHLLFIDAETGTPLWNFTPPEPTTVNITCLSVAANGDYVAIGTSNGSVYILDGSSGNIVQNWSFLGPIRDVTLSELGTFLGIAVAGFLVYASRHESTLLWARHIARPPHHCRRLSFRRSGSSFAVGLTNGRLYSVQAGDGDIIWEFVFDDAVDYLSLTVDDSFVAAATGETCVIFGQNGAVLQEYNLEHETLALSLTGRYFVLAQDRMVYIYSDNQPLPQYNHSFPAPITHLSLPQDGSYLLAGDVHGAAYALSTQENRLLWNIPLNEPILEFLIPDNDDYFVIVTQNSLVALLLTSKLANIYSTQAMVLFALSTVALVALTLWIILPWRYRKT